MDSGTDEITLPPAILAMVGVLRDVIVPRYTLLHRYCRCLSLDNYPPPP